MLKQLWIILALAALALAAFSCDTGDDDDDDNGDDDDDAGDDDDDDTNSGGDDTQPPDPVDCEEGLTYEGDPPSIVRGPFLSQVGTDSVMIRWDTDREANSVVKYGLDEVGELTACDFSPETHHEMMVFGLEPGLVYDYIVRSDGAQSATNSFTSAPGAEDSFTFAVWGDNRSIPENHREVALAMHEADPDFVINVGDIVGDGGVFEQYDEQFFEPARELLASKPFYVSIGNHEKEAEHYYDLLSLPGNESWYAYTYGNTRFISLNTNKLYIQSSKQYQWLEAELANARDNGAEWIVVYAHHPAYSEGWDSPGYQGEILMRVSVIPLLEKYDVDLFFAGHTHDYERGTLNGVTHIISGGGGSSLDSFQQDFDWITVYAAAFHYVYAEVVGETMYLEARQPDGTLLDQFMLEH